VKPGVHILLLVRVSSGCSRMGTRVEEEAA
jgi:hypothetical protein